MPPDPEQDRLLGREDKGLGVRESGKTSQRKPAESWGIQGSGRNGIPGGEAADRSKGLEAGTGGDGLTGMKIGTRQRRGYAAASLLSTASSPRAAGIQGLSLVGAAGHTSFLAQPSGAPQIAPKPPSPPHLLPQASPQEEQAEASTLPTRPEINISRETELVLSVFTAKGQAGWWGRGQPEAPVQPWGHSTWPSIGLGLLSALETVPTSSEPPFQVLEGTTRGLGCPQVWPRLSCVFPGCKCLVLDACPCRLGFFNGRTLGACPPLPPRVLVSQGCGQMDGQTDRTGWGGS